MFSAPITRLRTFAARGITATTGNDCPGADRKSFCLLLGKKFCGMYISPLDWRRRLWLSVPPATGTHTGVWHRTQQRAGTRRNDEERVRETALPLTSRRPFAGMPGAQVTARPERSLQARGFASGMEARQGGDSSAGSVHDSPPRQGDARKRHKQENNKTDNNQGSSNQSQNRRKKRIIKGKVM